MTLELWMFPIYIVGIIIGIFISAYIRHTTRWWAEDNTFWALVIILFWPAVVPILGGAIVVLGAFMLIVIGIMNGLDWGHERITQLLFVKKTDAK